MSWSSETTQRRAPRRGGAAAVATLELLWSPNPDPSGARVRRALAPRRPLVLGRQAEDGLVLRDGAASRRHATLTLDADEERVEVVDSSANGTFINGVAVEGSGAMVDGDVVRTGDSFLVLRFVPPDDEDANVEGILGRAPSVRALRRTLRLVAPTDATVLVLGETGTGKELVARAVHELSGRSGAFVAVNCAAIPENLAESQLFGHLAGAFTGAKGPSQGYFRASDGGTLFLDEVGELPSTLQPKLLRAIEERAVVPVGATEPVRCDLRLVAATHQDLRGHVERGGFRGDLFARLAEMVLETPTLRARREDILPILSHFLERPSKDLDPDLVEGLLAHPWPFNVRELVKVAKELSIRGQGKDVLERSLIEARLTVAEPAAQTPSAPAPSAPAPSAPAPSAPAVAEAAPKAPPPEDREPPTRDELEALLRDGKGNISFLARETGWSRRQLKRWLAEHALDPASYK